MPSHSPRLVAFIRTTPARPAVTPRGNADLDLAALAHGLAQLERIVGR